jgi:hypothetical protein
LAYTSNQSGKVQVYIRPVTATAAQWQVSKDGGAALFHSGMSDVRPNRSDYDVTPDGQRFLVILPENSTQNPIHIVLNWTAALNKK